MQMGDSDPPRPSLAAEPGCDTERKKRTRPVSACETCRSKKVKCILLPDEPACKVCTQSGKECLFRIDDLSPGLRRERFGSYDLPADSDYAATATEGKQEQKSPHKLEVKAKRKHTGKRIDDNRKPVKTKAIFRCFANPTKLAPPSVGSTVRGTYARTASGKDGATGSLDVRPVSNAEQLSVYSGVLALQSFARNPLLMATSPSLNAPGRPCDERASLFTTNQMPKRTVSEASSLDLKPHSQPPPCQNAPSCVVSPQADANGRAIQTGHSTPCGEDEDTTMVPSVPCTLQKITLPFFRWFGATANTPGIRSIKVEVYRDVNEISGHAGDVRHSPGNKGRPLILYAPPEPATHCKRSSSSSKTGSSHSTCVSDLFESSTPRYPRKDLLLHLIELFFRYFKASCFPWLDESEVTASAQSGELPAILANAICAMTARFSCNEDIVRVGKASEAFADMAKTLIVPMLSWPSIDVIEALVILSYAEFGAGADAGLWMYVGMALRMATDLGLQHESTMESMGEGRQQDRARFLFWSIVGLDRVTCFGTGRPLTIRDDSYDCKLPPLDEDSTTDKCLFVFIIRALIKRGRIGELINRRDEDFTYEQRGAQLRSLWHDVASFYDSLPADLRFGVHSFRKLAAVDKGCGFIYLHVLLQSTISLLNRPSLFRRFCRGVKMDPPSSLAAIANNVSETIVNVLRFAVDAGQRLSRLKDERLDVNPYIDCNPYLDQLILPAGRAFLSEREEARETLHRLGSTTKTRDTTSACSTEEALPNASNISAKLEHMRCLQTRLQYAQRNVRTCQQLLDHISQRWAGARWPARALRQEAEGHSSLDIGLAGTDEEAQPAPIRDVEMVLRWAKERRIRARRKESFNSATACRFARGDTSRIRREGEMVPQDAVTEGGATPLLGPNVSTDQPSEANPSWLGLDGSNPCPLGLGFSGSLEAGRNVDLDALIDAWMKEMDTMTPSTIIPSQSMYVPIRHNHKQHMCDLEESETFKTFGDSRSVRELERLEIQRPLDASQGVPTFRALDTHAEDRSTNSTTSTTSMQTDMGSPSRPQIKHSAAISQIAAHIDLDMSTMQLEELFSNESFTDAHEDEDNSRSQSQLPHDLSDCGSSMGNASTSFGTMAEDVIGMSQYAVALSDKRVKRQTEIRSAEGQQQEKAIGEDIRDDLSIFVHQDLDILPAALLNSFRFLPESGLTCATPMLSNALDELQDADSTFD